MAQMTVRDFIEDFRIHIGDNSHTFDEPTIISWLNMSLKELASQINKFSLFIKNDTLELADYTESGERATRWKLDDDSVGSILNVRSIRLFSSDPCVECDVPIVYVSPTLFKAKKARDCRGCKVKQCCVSEILYTTEKTTEGTFLVVSHPLPSTTIAEFSYQFVPKRYRLNNIDDVVPVSDLIYNLIVKLMEVYFHRYNADDIRATAIYEQIDKEIYELKQNLAFDQSDFILKRSW